jgi:hypothetical protein
MTDETAAPTEPYDPARAVQAILAWLDRWGIDAIPSEPIPPFDEGLLTSARAEAERVADAEGRLDQLRRLRRSIVDWAMGRYREARYGAVYFYGALEPPEQRREAIQVLLDAATAYLLVDVLPDDATTTLLARFDVKLGGPLFRVDDEVG